ncbi:hypothetical protein RHMOL_Rhmol08G0173400 [Rhododendron molle]|uniref:Uncharacterized protein n=1 Tax=Rhododendron molle TaxID=49168 RepID=A0ACC0MQT1_RHOML|nr:hypothetical protein RHMOL_Rhmol08G0173400 [Rhododendron molle]
MTDFYRSPNSNRLCHSLSPQGSPRGRSPPLAAYRRPRLKSPSRPRGRRPKKRMADQPPVRTLRDILNPGSPVQQSPIVLPVTTNANSFDFKHGYHNLIPIFRGLDRESTYDHIREFEELLNTFTTDAARLENGRLRLFPFSLKDKAKQWFTSLKPQSLRTWAAVKAEFHKKFFPVHRTKLLKEQIQNFKQKEGESFYKYWERFKDLVAALAHHGFDKPQLIGHFMQGCSQSSYQLIDTMVDGDFLDKTGVDAWEFLDQLADKNQSWDVVDMGERAMANQGPSGSGKFSLNEPNALESRV